MCDRCKSDGACICCPLSIFEPDEGELSPAAVAEGIGGIVRTILHFTPNVDDELAERIGEDVAALVLERLTAR